MPLLQRPGKPSIHYVIDDHTDPWRDAPSLLLQHGYGRSTEFWRSWVPYLSRFYRVIRADLRGLGRSPLDFDPHKEFSVANFLEDTAAVIDQVGGGRVHYCGESLGGILGLVLAATVPEKLRTLSVVAAPITIPKHTQETFAFGHPSWQDALRAMGSQGWAAAANASSRFPPGTDQGLMGWYAAEMGKTNVESLIALSRVAATVDISGYLPKVRVPTLGLYPTAGTITGFEEKQIRESVPGIRVINLPTRFHAIQVLMPAACAKAVLHFAGAYDGIVPHE
jgi:3-oxoadipate enol-lactonase